MESGDTDWQTSRDELWKEPLGRGERKNFERVNRPGRRSRRTRAAGWGTNRFRARLRSAPLHCARPAPHSKTPDGNLTTLLTTFIGAAAVVPTSSQVRQRPDFFGDSALAGGAQIPPNCPLKIMAEAFSNIKTIKYEGVMKLEVNTKVLPKEGTPVKLVIEVAKK